MPLPKMPSKPADVLNNKDIEATQRAARALLKKTHAHKVTKDKAASKSTSKKKTDADKPVATKVPLAEALAVIDTNNTKKTRKKLVDTTLQSPSSRTASRLGTKKCFVLDTNVLMHDPTALFRFEEHDVFIPMIVLEELDNHKQGLSDLARNVRQVSRILDRLVADVNESELSRGIALNSLGNRESNGLLFLQTDVQNIPLPDHLVATKADNQILATMLSLVKNHPEKTFVLVSKDINMRLKARALGLCSEDYFNDQVLEDADLLYSGALALSEDFWDIHGEHMSVFQQKDANGSNIACYAIEGTHSQSMLVNEFVYMPAENNTTSFEAIVSEITPKTITLRTLTDYIQKFSVWGIHARNKEQNFAINLLMNPDIDLVTLVGQAGTGKTLLALAAGLEQVLESKRYNEIIITRATIPVGEDIGFLPGNEQEKMSPWMGALDDNLEVLTDESNESNNWEKETTKSIVRSHISIKSTSFMRGRTFVNKFVIIDEAQNLTPKQMKTLLTRAGIGTKIVCLGNIAQIDTPYLTEGSSGLTYIVDKFKGWSHSGHIMLARGERSRLADHASEVL